MTRIPDAASHSLREIADALNLLAADMQLSGIRPRQTTLTARMSNAVDRLAWLIRYASPCDEDQGAGS